MRHPQRAQADPALDVPSRPTRLKAPQGWGHALSGSPRQVAQRQQISAAFGPCAGSGVTQREAQDRERFFAFLEDEKDMALAAGEFIWLFECEDDGNQSQWLCHLHIFKEMSSDSFAGQVTIRNRASDNGGIKFSGDDPQVTKEELTRAVLEKFGSEQAGSENRKRVVEGLVALFTQAKKKWQRWRLEA